MNGIESADVAQLSKTSIELAKAANDYGAMTIGYGVLMLIVLLMIIFFFSYIYSLSRKIGMVVEACDYVKRYFSELNDHTIGKEEAKMIVRMCYNAFEFSVKYNILKMREENHLSDKAMADIKIRNIVNNRMAEMKVLLSRFVCVGHSVSFTCTDEDTADMIQIMTDWVYKSADTFTVSLMSQDIGLYFDKLQLKATGKIDDVSE